VAHELVAVNRHDAEPAHVPDGHPDADGFLLLAAGDGGEPAAEGTLVEICCKEADGERTFEQYQAVEIEERHD
jgi:hypothetical protein